jgi:hypothetical protein
MRLDMPVGKLEFVDEPGYSFGSVDNVRRYRFSLALSTGALSSKHGVLLNGEPLAVFGSSGGASGIHTHSAITHDNAVYLAVGDRVACFQVEPFVMRWVLQIDPATCFGVHFCARRNALLSHGEIEISRFSEDGAIIWSASGADIFSEGFLLHADFVEAIDFNKRSYYFSYDDGHISHCAS